MDNKYIYSNNWWWFTKFQLYFYFSNIFLMLDNEYIHRGTVFLSILYKIWIYWKMFPRDQKISFLAFPKGYYWLYHWRPYLKLMIAIILYFLEHLSRSSFVFYPLVEFFFIVSPWHLSFKNTDLLFYHVIYYVFCVLMFLPIRATKWRICKHLKYWFLSTE